MNFYFEDFPKVKIDFLQRYFAIIILKNIVLIWFIKCFFFEITKVGLIV